VISTFEKGSINTRQHPFEDKRRRFIFIVYA
jgi:hypothetical protein